MGRLDPYSGAFKQKRMSFAKDLTIGEDKRIDVERVDARFPGLKRSDPSDRNTEPRPGARMAVSATWPAGDATAAPHTVRFNAHLNPQTVCGIHLFNSTGRETGHTAGISFPLVWVIFPSGFFGCYQVCFYPGFFSGGKRLSNPAPPDQVSATIGDNFFVIPESRSKPRSIRDKPLAL
jgi:hypothetical protein